MSMALQASIFASNAKANIRLTTVRLILNIFLDIVKHVASTLKGLLNPLLLHEKAGDQK